MQTPSTKLQSLLYAGWEKAPSGQVYWPTSCPDLNTYTIDEAYQIEFGKDDDTNGPQ